MPSGQKRAVGGREQARVKGGRRGGATRHACANYQSGGDRQVAHRLLLMPPPSRACLIAGAKSITLLSASGLAVALGERAQAQGVELDKALGIAVIIGGGAFLESHEILIVKRVGA